METKEGTEYSRLLFDAESGEISWHTGYSGLEREIKQYWDTTLRFAKVYYQRRKEPDLRRKEPEWSFGITAPFQSSIKNIDRNLQGRVFEAVLKICQSPMTPHGDAIKPLKGSLNGLWRARIGDHRLIYQPNAEDRKVLLLEFGPRGGIYG